MRVWDAANGKKTAIGIVLMLLAGAGLRFRLLPLEQAQALFLAGCGLATVGAGHKAVKRRRRKKASTK